MSMSVDCKLYVKCLLKVKNVSKRCKKLSGYNVFCMDSRKGLEGSPKEVMVKLGGLWRGLSDSKKEKFKLKSLKLNSAALAIYEEPEKDGDTEELRLLIKETISKFKKVLSNRVVESEVEESDEE